MVDDETVRVADLAPPLTFPSSRIPADRADRVRLPPLAKLVALEHLPSTRLLDQAEVTAVATNYSLVVTPLMMAAVTGLATSCPTNISAKTMVPIV
jgi:hypothetical protein